MAEQPSIWARRFIGVAIIQGAIAFVITVILLYMELPGSGFVTPARVVASGGAGTWFTVGYLGYIIFPVIGTGLSALFYHYIEVAMNRPYTGSLNGLAWGHLILGNVGIGAALLLMMWGGYQAGVAMLPTDVGGGGHLPTDPNSFTWVNVNILGPLEMTITTLFIIGTLGPLFGGIGYGLQMWKEA